MNNFNNFQRNQYPSYFNTSSTIANATNNIVWVQGIEGAKAWQLSPNSMVILLDSELENKMYIKVSDNIGMSTLRIFNYTEEFPTSGNNVTINHDLDLSKFVTKDELKDLVRELIENEQSVPTTFPTENTEPVKPQQPKVISYGKK